jgi:hypothetical protein
METLERLEGREQTLGSTDTRAQLCAFGDQLFLPGDQPLALVDALLCAIKPAQAIKPVQ